MRNGGGSDALTASNANASDHGYVFENCTIKSECPTVSLGRAWNNTPQVAFLNSLVDYSAGNFSFEGDNGKIQRWTKDLMSDGTGWPVFGEYNTHLADGTVLTPASNVVTFKQVAPLTGTQDIETVLSAADAATRTMEWTLGNWAATAAADAKQVVCDLNNIDAEGIYLVENEGQFIAIYTGAELQEEVLGEGATVRKANARGGFGWKAGEEPVDPTEGCEQVKSEELRVRSGKILRDGRVIIVRDGRMYDILGNELVK